MSLQFDLNVGPCWQRPFRVHETTQKAHVRSLGIQPNLRPQFNNLGFGYQLIARRATTLMIHEGTSFPQI
jgi:DNA helicase TIP49 (TBP-interacting protein)